MDRHKRSRAALSRLPASAADVGANIVLQPQQLRYVTANFRFVHNFDAVFGKSEVPSLASKRLLLAIVDGLPSWLTSIQATYLADAFSPRSPKR
jgi:hypothetical protein